MFRLTGHYTFTSLSPSFSPLAPRRLLATYGFLERIVSAEPRWKLGIIPRGSRGYLAILDYSSMLFSTDVSRPFPLLILPFLLQLSSNRAINPDAIPGKWSVLGGFSPPRSAWLIILSCTIFYDFIAFRSDDIVKRFLDKLINRIEFLNKYISSTSYINYKGEVYIFWKWFKNYSLFLKFSNK